MRRLLAIGAFTSLLVLSAAAHAAQTSCPSGYKYCRSNGKCCANGETCLSDGCGGGVNRTGVACGQGHCPPGYYCHNNPNGVPSCGKR